MSLKHLPTPQALERPNGYEWDAPAGALERWLALPQAAEADDPNTIDIFDFIGEDWLGEGFTEKRLAAALRKIGPHGVTVNINSPGGDMFAGLAIYNLLAEHPAPVTIKVMGVAASAASMIAMAGDEVLMGLGTTMMIHRAWGLVIGNRHDFADAGEVFDTFDRSMAEIYAARTGKAADAVLALLDGASKGADGTWFTADEAVAEGFADGTFNAPAPDPASAQAPAHILARRQIEADLARAGVPRPEREKRLNLLLGARDAARPAARDAGDHELVAGFRSLITTLTP